MIKDAVNIATNTFNSQTYMFEGHHQTGADHEIFQSAVNASQNSLHPIFAKLCTHKTDHLLLGLR